MTLFDIAYDDFKREDTTNTIVITLYTDDRQPITPDSSHTWKAKIAKGDKYVGEYPVTISGNTIKLSSSNLTRLPNGDYGLELWETYSGSTTIYPSAGVMEFRVHRNANDTLGTVDPTTDINGIIDDLHKAGQNIKVVATNTLPAGSKASVTQSIANGENQLTFNIPQGDKGDKGDKGDVGPAPTLKVGMVTKLGPDQAPTVAFTGDNGAYTLNMGIPQGETNETATNALNVANGVNSKVTEIQADGGGRNLLVGSDPTVGTPPSLNGVTQVDIDGVKAWKSTVNGSIYFNISLEDNTTYTYSALIKADTEFELGFNIYGHFQVKNPNAHNQTDPTHEDIPSKRDYHGINVPANQWTRIYYTFTTNDLSGSSFGVYPSHVDGDTAHTVYVRKLMLEKGTVAHDYQPAPEDVDNYASGRTITLPNKSSITVKDDRIIPRISLPTYITDNLPSIYFNAIGTFGEYDNLFVPSDTMATLGNRPINPDTNGSLTGDCFFSNHFAYSGAILRVFQKIYSCDYNYVFIRSYNGSSNSWSDWSCLARHA